MKNYRRPLGHVTQTACVTFRSPASSPAKSRLKHWLERCLPSGTSPFFRCRLESEGPKGLGQGASPPLEGLGSNPKGGPSPVCWDRPHSWVGPIFPRSPGRQKG